MVNLINSSPITLRWLDRLKSKIEELGHSITFGEAKFYLSLKSTKKRRNIAYLHPQKNKIRLFTRLDPSFDNSLKPTPSTSKYAKMYPSLFVITSENLINKAIELIISSYKEDLQK